MEKITVPPVEWTAEIGHAGWMRRNLAADPPVTSRTAPWGEELMQPWPKLSEQAKDLDREYVRDVYASIEIGTSAEVVIAEQ